MKLTLVGLPLGNIEDISLRAINTLKTAQVVVCEDTRVFNKLWMKLASLNLVAGKFVGRLLVLNDFNEGKQALSLMKVIEEADETILVSDAGMPLVSDPGFKLVREVIAGGGEVRVVPGPTALVTALAISGLPTDKFIFVGFLPQKNSKRNEVLDNIKTLPLKASVIMYESPYRLKKTLEELIGVLGDRDASVSFELTKQHEKTLRGKFSEILEQLGKTVSKGEVTIVFH